PISSGGAPRSTRCISPTRIDARRGSEAPVVTAIVSFMLLAGAGFAQRPPPAQGEFVPINQLPPGDRLPAAPLLIAAYAFVWVALLAYLWSIWRRLGKVEADLQTLERRSTPRSPAR